MKSNLPVKKYPEIGACGLDCGLCPAYHREASSKCPGCCGQDFFQKHPTCRHITCAVKEKVLETCAECADWNTCEKVSRLFRDAERRDSILSYTVIPARFAFIREHGIEEAARIMKSKQKLLKFLLDNYNDGRSRTFYCTSCQLLPPDRLKDAIMEASGVLNGIVDVKEKTAAMRAAISRLADSMEIDLRLRK